MSQRITIDPVTRIEGHLRIDCEIENGVVSKAWASGTMWRGMEEIVKNRDPRDAWMIVQRICGVCTTTHALCKQMQAECTFTNHAFDSLIPALKFKKYDAVISGMDITPERSKQVAFTDPYYANSALVIAKKDAFHSFDDLKGKRIGMENGTTHQKYLQDKHPEVKTVAYDSYQNAIIDLKNGRIDGVFGDTAVVNEWLKTNPQLGAATPKVTDPQYFGTGLGIAVRPDNKALLEKLNAALKAIKADGTYQKISNQWFPE